MKYLLLLLLILILFFSVVAQANSAYITYAMRYHSGGHILYHYAVPNSHGLSNRHYNLNYNSYYHHDYYRYYPGYGLQFRPYQPSQSYQPSYRPFPYNQPSIQVVPHVFPFNN